MNSVILKSPLTLYDLASGYGLASSLVARRSLPADVRALCWSSSATDLLAACSSTGLVVTWDVRMARPGGFQHLQCDGDTPTPTDGDGGKGSRDDGGSGGAVCWMEDEHSVIGSRDGELRHLCPDGEVASTGIK